MRVRFLTGLSACENADMKEKCQKEGRKEEKIMGGGSGQWTYCS